MAHNWPKNASHAGHFVARHLFVEMGAWPPCRAAMPHLHGAWLRPFSSMSGCPSPPSDSLTCPSALPHSLGPLPHTPQKPGRVSQWLPPSSGAPWPLLAFMPSCLLCLAAAATSFPWQHLASRDPPPWPVASGARQPQVGAVAARRCSWPHLLFPRHAMPRALVGAPSSGQATAPLPRR